MALVETALARGVLTITLADEARRNALSRQLLVELMAALDQVDQDPEVRVCIVTNRGSVFCAGANLSEQSDDTNIDRTPSVTLSELFQRIEHSPKVFVGRIGGHCVAGGVGLAAVMDISIALDSATFGFTEVRVGVAPAMISVVCLPKMRLGDARSAFLRGNRFAAETAVQLGLINQAVSADRLDGAVNEVINDLLAGEPNALAVTKQLLNHVPKMGTDDAFAWTTRLSTQLFSSSEAREGMTAFLEKRPASWVKALDDE